MTWHLPDGVDRMQVNAALTTLTERWDLDAALLTIHAFETLPELTAKQTGSFVQMGDTHDTTCGLTPEHGMVNIRGPERKDISQRWGPPEEATARIGSFKVLRIVGEQVTGKHRMVVVNFGPFQQDPLAIAELRPFQPSFGIEYLGGVCIPLRLIRYDYVPYRPPFWERWYRVIRCRMIEHRGKRVNIHYHRAEAMILHSISPEEFKLAASRLA